MLVIRRKTSEPEPMSEVWTTKICVVKKDGSELDPATYPNAGSMATIIYDDNTTNTPMGWNDASGNFYWLKVSHLSQDVFNAWNNLDTSEAPYAYINEEEDLYNIDNINYIADDDRIYITLKDKSSSGTGGGTITASPGKYCLGIYVDDDPTLGLVCIGDLSDQDSTGRYFGFSAPYPFVEVTLEGRDSAFASNHKPCGLIGGSIIEYYSMSSGVDMPDEGALIEKVLAPGDGPGDYPTTIYIPGSFQYGSSYSNLENPSADGKNDFQFKQYKYEMNGEKHGFYGTAYSSGQPPWASDYRMIIDISSNQSDYLVKSVNFDTGGVDDIGISASGNVDDATGGYGNTAGSGGGGPWYSVQPYMDFNATCDETGNPSCGFYSGGGSGPQLIPVQFYFVTHNIPTTTPEPETRARAGA